MRDGGENLLTIRLVNEIRFCDNRIFFLCKGKNTMAERCVIHFFFGAEFTMFLQQFGKTANDFVIRAFFLKGGES